MYSYDVGMQPQKRRARRAKRFMMLMLVILIFGGAAFAVDWFLAQLHSKESVVTVTEESVYAARITLFKTPYFQFQADDTWQAVAEVGSDTVFVYKRFNATLVENEFTVYVNDRPPVDMAATNVYSVRVVGDVLQPQAEPSDHCRSATNTTLEPTTVTLDDVTFFCNVESNTSRTFIGEAGGTNALPVLRPNGEAATYTLVFDDHRFTPDATWLKTIVGSFKIL